MGRIDDYWDERNKKNLDGSPTAVLAEALLEFMKESYIAGWIDHGRAEEADKIKASEDKNHE